MAVGAGGRDDRAGHMPSIAMGSKDREDCMEVGCDPRLYISSSNGSGQNFLGRGAPLLPEAKLSSDSEEKGGSIPTEGLSVRIKLLDKTITHFILRVLPLGGYELRVTLRHKGRGCNIATSRTVPTG
jgi:hypothetical protein